MASLNIHPACSLFPRLPEEELQALADDIKANGLLNPIVTLDGQILDGRNRYEACGIAGVKPHFVNWSGEGSPLAWVVATNLMRRHLTATQRAVIAFDLLPMLEAEAKARQKRSPGRGKKVANELATFSEPGKASLMAARITKSNSAYVEKVKAISQQAPEVVAEMKAGRVTVSDAVRLAKQPASQRKKVLAAARKQPNEPLKRIMRRVMVEDAHAPATPKRQGKAKIEVICGDCVQVMRERIADESISVVTTSPPYNQGIRYRSYEDNLDESDYLAWMSDVFTEIKRVLKPGGSFFMIMGHAPTKQWTPMRVAEVAGKMFQLQNQIVWVKSITIDDSSRGHFTPIQGERFLNRSWEFVFHFTTTGKVPLDRLAVGVPYEYEINTARTGSKMRCGGDVWFVPHQTVQGAEDRADHPATFPPELAVRCIKLAGIDKDTVVLDPFCGVNGMVAASQLGVPGIGIELDAAYCEAARRRIGQ